VSIPDDLRFTSTHEWVRDNGDGTVTIGITAHAAEQLGDVVYWEGPEAGAHVDVGDQLGTVESVKAVSDVYAPLAGEIVENNDGLEDAPETVNSAPYGDGWMVRLKLDDASSLSTLLDAAAYRAEIGA
jgi:glycine cleavage system H protein